MGSFILSATAGFYPATIQSLPSAMKLISGHKEQSRLEEGINCEGRGLPRKFVKYAEIGIYGLGLSVLPIRVGALIYGLVSGDKDAAASGTAVLSGGAGLVSYVTGNYLQRIDTGGPPKRPKRKTLKERLNDFRENAYGWFPQPIQEPAPVPVVNNMAELYKD